MVLGALASLSAAASCDSDTVSGAGSPREAEPGDVLITLSERASDAFYPASIVRGRLTERAGCLLFRHRVATWSADFGWDADGHKVTWPGGELAVGDHGVFGGGARPILSQEDLLRDTLYTAESARALIRCSLATGTSESVVLTPPDS